MTCSSAADFLRMIRPCALTSCGQLRRGEAGAVLHVDGVDVRIGAEREGDGEGVAAVGAAGGLIVEHVVDAVDLLLDRLRDRGLDHLGVGARDRCAVSVTCGGTISGNCAIGIAAIAMMPASVMTMETTKASRGRSMKMPENIRLSFRGTTRRRHDLSGTHLLDALDDDLLALLEAAR